jgi:pimeloyl-ACP methyl ester carboxylesterase
MRSSIEPILVLVHAFPMGAAMWEPQRAAAPGWRIVTPSLPGFDGRSLLAENTMSAYTRDLLNVLDRQGVRRAVFGGLSLGGYVLFELLRQAPERVAGLILADTRTSIDVITPPSDAGFMHSMVDGATLITIPGAGHMANVEAPDASTQP